MTTVSFATFCHKGDIHRLYTPGQLRRQIESNNYAFDHIIVVHQCCEPGNLDIDNVTTPVIRDEDAIDQLLQTFGIDINRPQYESTTDKVHRWRYHVVNHLKAAQETTADYIIFADSDCWMVEQPVNESWIEQGIKWLKTHPTTFIISPNDGESKRATFRMSQQMFLVKTDDFMQMDFDQPRWDGNVNIPGGPIPEYWAMLEGRMELYCRATDKWRYVLPPEYRYWHFNRSTQDGLLETDRNKYR